ncbi:hypothetical protein ABZ502_17420 [Streptomyces abikoensis]|uniref:hypothetical protein n=1 Tax=Streptomyces abikoensis TaxID=97398 RepID=UPI0033D4D601
MPSPHHPPHAQTAESLAHHRYAYELTVRDMLVLYEVAVEGDPGRRREAARQALAVARRNTADRADPLEVRPMLWDIGHRRVPQPPRAGYVLDCDGRVWEREHVVEDSTVLAVDRWTPLAPAAVPPPRPSYGWDELTRHHGPLVDWMRLPWPHTPANSPAGGSCPW